LEPFNIEKTSQVITSGLAGAVDHFNPETKAGFTFGAASQPSTEECEHFITLCRKIKSLRYSKDSPFGLSPTRLLGSNLGRVGDGSFSNEENGARAD
jgi:hypothetical protein